MDSATKKELSDGELSDDDEDLDTTVCKTCNLTFANNKVSKVEISFIFKKYDTMFLMYYIGFSFHFCWVNSVYYLLGIRGCAVVLRCCKGDQPFQWENPKFDPPVNPKPLNFFTSIFAQIIRSGISPNMQIW